jgi:hypothetical protein
LAFELFGHTRANCRSTRLVEPPASLTLLSAEGEAWPERALALSAPCQASRQEEPRSKT